MSWLGDPVGFEKFCICRYPSKNQIRKHHRVGWSFPAGDHWFGGQSLSSPGTMLEMPSSGAAILGEHRLFAVRPRDRFPASLENESASAGPDTMPMALGWLPPGLGREAALFFHSPRRVIRCLSRRRVGSRSRPGSSGDFVVDSLNGCRRSRPGRAVLF